MSLFNHFSTINHLSSPVQGQSVSLDTVGDARNIPGQIRLAIQPNNVAIYAPLNGEVTAMTSHHIAMTAISGKHYWLTLQTANVEIPSTFDWQIRVGDTISPLTLLGTLNSLSQTSLVICSQLGVTTSESTSKRRRLSAIFS